jgi:UDP-glucose 4-epimerase
MELKHVLITGGTGSFGQVMAQRLIAEPGVEKITIFSRDEFKQHDMREIFDSTKLSFVIGDVRDRDAVADAVRGVDAIFHAAALKSVPTGEFFPMEDVRTNTIGTAHVLDAAEKAGVGRVILLSTDKAVYPINVMGMTKALAEKLAEAKGRNTPSDTIFSITRYGNVMGSRG